MRNIVLFQFKGSGNLLVGFLNGVPARDLTEEDWGRLGEMERMAVEKSGLYERVKEGGEKEKGKKGEGE